jgi:hypothetical protein
MDAYNANYVGGDVVTGTNERVTCPRRTSRR